MVKFNKNSVSLSTFGVTSNAELSSFYLSWWQRGAAPAWLLAVRALLAAAALAILAWSLAEGASRYWLIYLTNWGVLLVAATALSGLLMSLTFTFTKPIERARLPWFVSVYWALFNVTLTMSIMITALYWILLYNPELYEREARLFWLDVSTHGLTSCVMMLELLVSRTRVLLAHIYQPLALGLWYAIFSAIYYVAGGTDAFGNRYIYEVLDWGNTTQAIIVVIGSVAGLVILYLILWGIAFCRDKLGACAGRGSRHELRATPPPQQTSHIV